MKKMLDIEGQERVLIIAAHPDDEVLGCGGTIARMVSEGSSVHVLMMADGETSRSFEPEQREIEVDRIEARNASAEKACKILGCSSVDVLGLSDNRLDGLELLDLVKNIETFVQRYRPSKVFTHHAGDVNIDHQVVHNAVISACRPQPDFSVKELLFFEVPSATEWRPPSSDNQFNPNWFVDISLTLEVKLEALRAYETELRKFPHPRSLNAVKALAQWRGVTVGVEAAEAFVLGRMIVK